MPSVISCINALNANILCTLILRPNTNAVIITVIGARYFYRSILTQGLLQNTK